MNATHLLDFRGGPRRASAACVKPSLHLRFDRGTVCIDGAERLARNLPSVLWDDRTLGYRAPAWAAPALVSQIEAMGLTHDAALWPTDVSPAELWAFPSLRPYQQESLDAWMAFERRGIVAVPTGGGKTRIAIAAMARLRCPAAVLCPTRALLSQWRKELATWYSGPIGAIGDGDNQLESLTVMTFASAFQRMDTIGNRFALVVIDEVHHFQGEARAETLEMATAPWRLGLTATAPPEGTAGAARLENLVGPIVSEIGLGELLGTHLADLTVVRLAVRLSDEERRIYESAYAPFAELRAAFSRAHPEADWEALAHALGRSSAGRAAMAGFRRAVTIASFPEAKRALTRRLMEKHRGDKALVFTASVDDAYRVANDCLIPALTAETSRAERDAVLGRFRDGRLRAIVSARVLNEGLDVPDARVAIVVGGAQGKRELVQRVGRVLRPAPGKQALVYELSTRGTIDDRRVQARRRQLAPDCAALG